MKLYDAALFGAAVKRRRKELGYTQQEVADVSGCSAAYLSALENGKATAELGRALRVASMLGIDIVAMRRTGGEL